MPDINISSSNISGPEKYRKALEEVFESSGFTDIVVRVPHQSRKAPIHEEGKLHIFCWSQTGEGVRGDANFKLPVCGVSDSSRICTDSPYDPLPQYPLISSPEGTPLAQVVEGDNIYFLYDATHYSSDESVEVFKYVLEEALQYLVVHEPSSPEEIFVKMCSQYEESHKSTLEADILSLQRIIRDYENGLINYHRRLMTKNATLKGLQTTANEQYLEMLKVIADHPMTEKVTVKNEYVVVTTKNIYIENVLIGVFEITLTANGPTCINITNKKGDTHHPHVRDSICWGNLSSAVSLYIAERQYDVVYDILITLLQSYNDGDAYVNISLWGTLNSETSAIIDEDDEEEYYEAEE